jgi:hypothetical protein
VTSDRAEVDVILEDLWREDRNRGCWTMSVADGSEMLTGIRRVLEGRQWRWGSSGGVRVPGNHLRRRTSSVSVRERSKNSAK